MISPCNLVLNLDECQLNQTPNHTAEIIILYHNFFHESTNCY